MKIKVEGKEYEVLFEFDVLHCGWECDPKAWVVETASGRRLVHTNYGQKYFAKESEFTSNIEYYDQVVADTQKALDMLGENK